MKELQHIVGKKARIKDCVEVNYGGKNKIKADIVGIIQFIGANEILGWPLQVTINRTPIQLDSLKQIELIENEE